MTDADLIVVRTFPNRMEANLAQSATSLDCSTIYIRAPSGTSLDASMVACWTDSGRSGPTTRTSEPDLDPFTIPSHSKNHFAEISPAITRSAV